MSRPIRLLHRDRPPCGSACVEGAWQRLDRWLRRPQPPALPYLRRGATAGQIRAFETAIGRPLPEEVRLSFQLHDGLPGGIFSGMDFLSLEESLYRWRLWRSVFEGVPSGPGIPSFSSGAIRPDDFNLGWVPLWVKHPPGRTLAIDLDPDREGVAGQVITFGRGNKQEVVLAWTWGWFLTDLAAELEQGNFRLLANDGLCLRSPRVRHFLDAVEDWSKAKSGGRRPEANWAIDPTWLAWNDSAVVRLARSICQERALDRLPILGDALEDAGCSDDAILNHCRQPGEHGSGCWLVEALQGNRQVTT